MSVIRLLFYYYVVCMVGLALTLLAGCAQLPSCGSACSVTIGGF